MRRHHATAAVLLSVAVPVFGQTGGAGGDSSLQDTIIKFAGNDGVAKVISALSEDIPMTEAPAAYVLGVAGGQVPRFTTFREFAVAVGRAFDKDGKLVNSMSAEIAPALALRVYTLEDQKNWYSRAIARTTVSIVSLAGSADSNSRAAYGIQSVLYSREMDEAIATASSDRCRTVPADFLKNTPSSSPTEPGMPGGPSPEVRASAEACQKSIDQIVNRWNQSMVAVGLGQAFTSVDNASSRLRKANQVAWLTGSLGFGFGRGFTGNDDMGGLLTLHARAERDNVIDSPADPTVKLLEDADLFGANFRVGKARFNGLIELSERRSTVRTLAAERRARTLIGAEYRVQKDLYLSFAIGSERGRRDGRNADLALANLKWGFGDRSLFAK